MSNQKAPKCTWRNFMSPQQNKFLTFGTDLSNNKKHNANGTTNDSKASSNSKSGSNFQMNNRQKNSQNSKKVYGVDIQQEDEINSQTPKKGWAVNFERIASKEYDQSPVFRINEQQNKWKCGQNYQQNKGQIISDGSLSDIIEKQIVLTEQYPTHNQKPSFYLQNNLRQQQDYPKYFSHQNNGVIFYNNRITSSNQRDASFSQKRTVNRSATLISKKISQELSNTIQQLCSINRQQLLTQKKIFKILESQRNEKLGTNSKSLLKRRDISKGKGQNESKSSKKVSTIKKKSQNVVINKNSKNSSTIMNNTTTKKKQQKFQDRMNQKIKQLQKLKSDLQGMLTKKLKK